MGINVSVPPGGGGGGGSSELSSGVFEVVTEGSVTVAANGIERVELSGSLSEDSFYFPMGWIEGPSGSHMVSWGARDTSDTDPTRQVDLAIEYFANEGFATNLRIENDSDFGNTVYYKVLKSSPTA